MWASKPVELANTGLTHSRRAPACAPDSYVPTAVVYPSFRGRLPFFSLSLPFFNKVINDSNCRDHYLTVWPINTWPRRATLFTAKQLSIPHLL
jgi:hypothetical protein